MLKYSFCIVVFVVTVDVGSSLLTIVVTLVGDGYYCLLPLFVLVLVSCCFCLSFLYMIVAIVFFAIHLCCFLCFLYLCLSSLSL